MACASNARIVQRQDGAETTAQMAVRIRPPRSIPKALDIKPVLPSVVRGIITDFHYLHAMPAAARMCFGVYFDAHLAGAVVFTAGARRAHEMLSAAKPQEVATLARLWLSDALPKNCESRVIGIALRHLRNNTDWKLVLSYADPSAGHVGTIYQATGWLYLGQGAPAAYIELPDGKVVHPRTAYGLFGSNAVGHLSRTGISVRRRAVASKHRYAYVLDPSWQWRLRHSPSPYPKPERAP